LSARNWRMMVSCAMAWQQAPRVIPS
jgi:hypothetical protein